PAGVVGRVPEVLLAVRRELSLLTAGNVAHPEIPVADVRRLRAVGRQHGVRRAASTAAATTSAAATASAAAAGGVSVSRRRNARTVGACGVTDDFGLLRRIDENEVRVRRSGAIPH